MRIETYANAAGFLAAAETYLLEREVENNLILGIAHGLASAPPALDPPPYLAIARDDGIQGCVFSTLAHKAAVTRCASREALTLLSRGLFEVRPGIRDLLGPEPTVGVLVELFAALSGTRVVRRIAQRIHECRALAPLQLQPPGRFRPAVATDVVLLANWLGEFMTELADPQGDPQEIAASRVAAGQLFLWEDGVPVSMAGWTGRTPRGVRIGFVYTPVDRRGQGYATGCVWDLTSELLRSGLQYCCLYTDLANPTSNAIYGRIGYRPVSDAAMYTLAF